MNDEINLYVIIKKDLKKIDFQVFKYTISDPAGTRTQGPNIKSVVLYQLSYEIILPHFQNGTQK